MIRSLALAFALLAAGSPLASAETYVDTSGKIVNPIVLMCSTGQRNSDGSIKVAPCVMPFYQDAGSGQPAVVTQPFGRSPGRQ